VRLLKSDEAAAELRLEAVDAAAHRHEIIANGRAVSGRQVVFVECGHSETEQPLGLARTSAIGCCEGHGPLAPTGAAIGHGPRGRRRRRCCHHHRIVWYTTL
jgi:hypothetical protein